MEGEKWGMSLRMRMIIIELLINFCWFPITFATNPTVSTNVQIEKEKEREVVEEIQIESTWEERSGQNKCSKKTEDSRPFKTRQCGKTLCPEHSHRHQRNK